MVKNVVSIATVAAAAVGLPPAADVSLKSKRSNSRSLKNALEGSKKSLTSPDLSRSREMPSMIYNLSKKS